MIDSYLMLHPLSLFGVIQLTQSQTHLMVQVIWITPCDLEHGICTELSDWVITTKAHAQSNMLFLRQINEEMFSICMCVVMFKNFRKLIKSDDRHGILWCHILWTSLGEKIRNFKLFANANNEVLPELEEQLFFGRTLCFNNWKRSNVVVCKNMQHSFLHLPVIN